jgi:hypothetical protein
VNLYGFIKNDALNQQDLLGLVSQQELMRLLADPFIKAGRGIRDATSEAFESLNSEIQAGFTEWKDHAKIKGHWKKEWRKKVPLGGVFAFQGGVGYKISSDGCCVKVTGYGFGQIEGKAPIFTVGAATINLVGRGGLTLQGSYQYCWKTDETGWEGGWGWYVNGGVQAEFGRDIIVAKAKVVFEAGVGASGQYSFKNQSWSDVKFGAYVRAYAEWGVGWWDEREEIKVSWGDLPVF